MTSSWFGASMWRYRGMHAAFLVAAAVALAGALIGLLTRRGNGGAEAARAGI